MEILRNRFFSDGSNEEGQLKMKSYKKVKQEIIFPSQYYLNKKKTKLELRIEKILVFPKNLWLISKKKDIGEEIKSCQLALNAYKVIRYHPNQSFIKRRNWKKKLFNVMNLISVQKIQRKLLRRYKWLLY